MSKPPLDSLTIKDVQRALQGPLPGVAGQKKMAPQPRPKERSRWPEPENCREAGVLLFLYPHATNGQAPELHLVLIRRPDYEGVHGGQISFPGGQREAEESLQATALRETKEELGVPPDTLEIIGRLSPLYTPPSNFCIYPFVGYRADRPSFRPNPYEVAAILELPLSHLLNPAVRKEELWDFARGGERRIPFFDVFGHKVWGATAMMLSEFVTVLTSSVHGNETGLADSQSYFLSGN
jgi:8-oxo-dGTP pyrophosphatase MutT (NUDIX family)